MGGLCSPSERWGHNIHCSEFQFIWVRVFPNNVYTHTHTRADVCPAVFCWLFLFLKPQQGTFVFGRSVCYWDQEIRSPCGTGTRGPSPSANATYQRISTNLTRTRDGWDFIRGFSDFLSLCSSPTFSSLFWSWLRDTVVNIVELFEPNLHMQISSLTVCRPADDTGAVRINSMRPF